MNSSKWKPTRNQVVVLQYAFVFLPDDFIEQESEVLSLSQNYFWRTSKEAKTIW